jgi:hypothetical protein
VQITGIENKIQGKKKFKQQQQKEQNNRKTNNARRKTNALPDQHPLPYEQQACGRAERGATPAAQA